jgi:hypothetical protein
MSSTTVPLRRRAHDYRAFAGCMIAIGISWSGCGGNEESEGNGGPIVIDCETDQQCREAYAERPWAYDSASTIRCVEAATSTARCIACDQDAECGTGKRCGDNGDCYAVRPCSHTSDCGGLGDAHDACVAGVCQPCGADAQCGTEERCFALELERGLLATFCLVTDHVDVACQERQCSTECVLDRRGDETSAYVRCRPVNTGEG